LREMWGCADVGRGKMGWTSLPLLKRKTRRCLQIKDKVRSALLVLTITDEQAALAAAESNQLLHLQLGMRYYAEALDFMRMVEGAMYVFFSSFPFSPCFHSHCLEKLLTRFIF
jgi:hypothetical protein